MDTLRIGYLSTMYHTAHIIKELGWVEKYTGAASQWQLFGTGPAMVEAFGAGIIDIGYIGLPPAMIAIGKDIPLKCIGGGHVEGTVMIARQGVAAAVTDQDIPAVLKQFEGSRLGSPARGSIHDVLIRHLIETYGLVQTEVANYPWADLIPEAINEGEICGAVGTPPLAVLASKWYDHSIIIPPALLWPFNPSYGIVVRKDMLGRPNLLEQFLSIHEQACNFIREKPHEASKVVAHAVKIVGTDFIREVFAISPRYCASVPPEYIDATMRFIPVLQQMGYLEGDLSQDDVFELSLIEKVHPEGQHYKKS